MRHYLGQIREMEEDAFRYFKKVKEQLKELEESYPSDTALTELYGEVGKDLREKGGLEETIFPAMRQWFKKESEETGEQREPDHTHQEQEEESWDWS